MANKNIAVFGIYPNELDSAECIDQLRNSGFRGPDVSLLYFGKRRQ